MASEAAVIAHARAALRCLARKTAVATADAANGMDRDRRWAVRVPGEGAPQAFIAGRVMAELRRCGWVERDGSVQEGLRLAPAGRKALRRMALEPKPKASRERKEAGGTGEIRNESPLAWLRRRRDKSGRPLITEAQYTAGERLAEDYRRAQIVRRVTTDWSSVAPPQRTKRGAPGAGIDMSEAAAAARQRVNRALSAVGSELAGILIDVCCHETGLEAAERAEGWPQRAAKVVLQLALTALARHYGLIAPEPAPFARLRHWGDADYRPTADAWR